MTDDRVASTLAKIRAEALGSIAYAGDHTCPDADASCSAHHALRLLAAVEAALKEHQPVDRGGGLESICGTCHRGFWPCPTYRAITAALTGTETPGDH